MFLKAQWNWGPLKLSVGVDPFLMLSGPILPIGIGNFSFYLGNVIKVSGKDFIVDCADLLVRRIFKECVRNFFIHREKKEGKHTWSHVFEVLKLVAVAITVIAGLQLFGHDSLYTPNTTLFTTASALTVLAYHHLHKDISKHVENLGNQLFQKVGPCLP